MNEQRTPCPFCGEVLRLYAWSNGNGAHFVACGNCGASGPACENEYHAERAWETRERK